MEQAVVMPIITTCTTSGSSTISTTSTTRCLTFEASAATTVVDLQYSPPLAMEAAAWSFRVP